MATFQVCYLPIQRPPLLLLPPPPLSSPFLPPPSPSFSPPPPSPLLLPPTSPLLKVWSTLLQKRKTIETQFIGYSMAIWASMLSHCPTYCNLITFIDQRPHPVISIMAKCQMKCPIYGLFPSAVVSWFDYNLG